MARRKAAGKDSRAKPARPAGGGRKSTRKPTASKAVRKKRAAKAAPPRKRPPARARKPRTRAAPRPGGRARKVARPESLKEVLPEEPGEALDPELAEPARGETSLLGRGPHWWNSSLGGTKPGARVPPALRRGAREDDSEELAAEPPIPIGFFALPATAPDLEPEATPEATPDAADQPETRDAPSDEADEALVAAGPRGDLSPRPQITPSPHAVPVEPKPRLDIPLDEPVAGIAAEREDEPSDAGSADAAPSGTGVMQMLLGTVARSRPDGADAPLAGPIAPKDRPAPLHIPVDAPMNSAHSAHAAHGAKGDPPPVDDDAGWGGQKPAPADMEALDAQIASDLTDLNGLDGAEELSQRDLPGPRTSAGAEAGPGEPAPRPLRAAAPTRESPAGPPGPQPRAARLRGEARAAAAGPAKKSRSPLVAALAAFNYPLRGLPPSARRIVGWIAASLLLWVPIVWLIAIYFIGR